MNQFGDEGLNAVLLGSIPKHADLFYLQGTISLPVSEKGTANVSNKAYQCQIFKCRCLIFSVPEVIASPVLGAVQHIHIIVSQKFYESGKLNPHLDKINITVQEVIPVTNAVYETCLRYTILARLAPSWNQVERYLVHGRNFLVSSAPLNAVKLDVVINENEMHIVLWPLRLRLPQVCTQDLQISSFNPPFTWEFSNCPKVHVLPSLNQANILMVSGHIPENSLFKTYKDLKRHWKNSYGYRLPESEEGIIYLTVKFGRWFSESLTYPIMCVRSRRPVFLRQHEPQKVLMDLLADLHAKVPYVCGFPFGVDTTIRYAMPKLNILSQIIFPCNLSETRQYVKKHTVSTDFEESTTETQSQLVSQYTQSQTSRQHDLKTRSISPPPFLPHLSKLLPNTPSKPVYVPIFTAKTKPKLDDDSTSTTITCQQQPSSSPPREESIRPIFEGISIKPMFGVAKIPPSQNIFHTNKPVSSNPSNFTCKKVCPIPIFNPCSPTKPFNRLNWEKTPLHLPQTANKKVRNKPQVQQGVDVEALAHTKDGLVKVNTTTLIAYLRSEGVPCKVKDRKGELVKKVLTHLNLPLPATSSDSQDKEMI